MHTTISVNFKREQILFVNTILEKRCDLTRARAHTPKIFKYIIIRSEYIIHSRYDKKKRMIFIHSLQFI